VVLILQIVTIVATALTGLKLILSSGCCKFEIANVQALPNVEERPSVSNTTQSVQGSEPDANDV